MVNALWITLIGMSLVFVAILLLWGMMALLVRLTAEREDVVAEVSAANKDDGESIPLVSSAIPESALEHERKRRAAAAGLAVAMALQAQVAPDTTTKPVSSLSAWQLVHRAGQASQRVNSRKKVAR